MVIVFIMMMFTAAVFMIMMVVFMVVMVFVTFGSHDRIRLLCRNDRVRL